MSASGIHVARYWTELPPIEIFQRKIGEIVLQTKKYMKIKIFVRSLGCMKVN